MGGQRTARVCLPVLVYFIYTHHRVYILSYDDLLQCLKSLTIPITTPI